MTIKIIPLPAYQDNYIWLIHDGQQAAVVDPGDAAPVTRFLNDNNLSLAAILITHHHWDHVNGIEKLQAEHLCTVYAPRDDRIPGKLTHMVAGNVAEIPALNLAFNVIETPGHTLSHICYYNEQWLFCGDTLFSIGCGRMFEGTPQQYMTSLNKIKQLPAATKIFCTHEYTTTNVTFARNVEPNNSLLQKYQNHVQSLRNKNQASLPVLLSNELQMNPFLRTHERSIQTAVGKQFETTANDEVSCFALLRQWKDQF